MFFEPPPSDIVEKLLAAKAITEWQARMAPTVPMADDVCVESDSAGHTDKGVAQALVPAIVRIRDRTQQKFQFESPIRVGAAGGIGTPEAAAAAFTLGADFILTGSVNQCSVEAATSDMAKDMLQNASVSDTDYAPAGDLFELGSQIQVLSRRLLFPPRARRLYQLWKNHQAIEEIDPAIQREIQDTFFRRSFDEVYEETERFYREFNPAVIERARDEPRQKMVMIFRWYFIYSMRIALRGIDEDRSNFQIQCGPSMGEFNDVVAGGTLENWRNRHVDLIADFIMEGAANLFERQFQKHAGESDERSGPRL